MRTWKPAITVAAILMLGLCLSAAAQDAPVTIELWDVYGSATPFTDEKLAEFASEYPNIQVDVQRLGFSAFYDKLPLVLTSGDVPDVITSGIMWAPQFVTLGAYADVMPLSNGTLNGQPFESVLPKGMLDAARVGDGIVGIPFDFDAYAFYYRKDLFDAAGVSDIPTTWDGFAAALAKVSDASAGQYGIIVDPTWNSWDPVLYAFGGRYLDEAGKAVFNSAEAVSSLQYLKDLVDTGVGIIPAPGEYTSLLASGQAASFYNGPYMMGVLRNSAPDLEGDWRIASLPTQPAFGTHIGGTYLSIMAGSEHKEAAWTFIEFMMRQENQEYLWQTAGAAPALIPAMTSSVVAEPDPYFGGEVAIPIFQYAISHGIPNPTVEAWAEVNGLVNTALQDVLLNGADIQATLDDAVDAANAILAP